MADEVPSESKVSSGLGKIDLEGILSFYTDELHLVSYDI